MYTGLHCKSSNHRAKAGGSPVVEGDNMGFSRVRYSKTIDNRFRQRKANRIRKAICLREGEIPFAREKPFADN